MNGATHADSSGNNRKTAFTLAEVLITLGIIGIVAAMTLPSLIARHRSKVLEAQFHKRYNELSQALLMIKKEEQGLYGNFTGPVIQQYIAKQFKGAKAVAYLYPLSSDVQKVKIGYELPVYKTYNKALDFKASLLDDGSVIVSKDFFIFINTDLNSTTDIQFIIDINGLQRPNLMGYDVFVFSLDKTDTLVPVCKQIEKCSKDSTTTANGFCCSYFAMTERDYFKSLNW